MYFLDNDLKGQPSMLFGKSGKFKVKK